jgi:HD-GYP domain-containing protein (c-di-GMP phosphodiesterase class II)
MATKVLTTNLRMGMFVAELDRPWTDTPFLLQGFLIDSDDQIAELQKHCEYVIVDRARSVGKEFQAPTEAPRPAPAPARSTTAPQPAPVSGKSKGNGADSAPAAERQVRATPAGGAQRRVIRLEDIAARRDSGHRAAAPDDEQGDYPGLLGRVLSGFKGMWSRERGPQTSGGGTNLAEVPVETPQEFAARAALIPAGLPVQTYVNQVSVEQEAPRARAIVQEATEVLDKLIGDIKLGQSFEVEEMEEIVDDMVESIVRNPDALMWVARLREQDITAYGHGLQVSVYLTAFGRHLGFPKPQLGQLAQVGLLLDIGKIRLPKDILEKQGTLSPAEFDEAKKHVDYGLEILQQTPGFDGEVVLAIAQHHERMNGGGYPKGLVGSEIGVFGRMAAIVDCFAALTNHRPYAAASSSYEALRSLTGWAGEYFHEPLVQQFVSSVGVFPVGSLIELSTGEVAVVVEHSKVRRLKPRVLVITGPDKTPSSHPSLLDLLYEPKHSDETIFIRRGLAAGAYGLDLKDFYLA